MAKRTDNARWAQFLIDLSEALLYDDIMLDRWVRNLLKEGGKSAGLKGLNKFFLGVNSFRMQLADEANSRTVDALELQFDEFIDSSFDEIFNFFSDSSTNWTVKSVILTLALEFAAKSQSLSERSSAAALRSEVRSALVDQFAGFGPNRLSKAALRYSYGIGLSSKKIGTITYSAFDGDLGNLVLELLGAAKEFDENKTTPEEKKQDADDYLVATQPTGEQDELSYEEWAEEASKSLGISPAYIDRVLKKSPKQGKEVAPAQAHERELSNGAKFGLNYLTLFDPRLEDRDETWFLRQYAFLTDPKVDKKEGGND